MTNNKLTDERPDDESLEFLITIRRGIAERHASEGHMTKSAVHTLLLNALLELQELRRAYRAQHGEIEDVRSQLYKSENQANEYASELQERRKAEAPE